MNSILCTEKFNDDSFEINWVLTVYLIKFCMIILIISFNAEFMQSMEMWYVAWIKIENSTQQSW